MSLTSWAGVLTGGEHHSSLLREAERIVRVQLQLAIVVIVHGALAGTIWLEELPRVHISQVVVGSPALDGPDGTDKPGPSEVQ